METRVIKDKEGSPMTTKDGKQLIEFRLQPGDEFIPLFNSVREKSTNYKDEEGKDKTAVNYSIKARVRGPDKVPVHDEEGSDEIFVTLTPAQAQSLRAKAQDGVELNQHKFVAYEYEHPTFGKQIGVGLNNMKKPKTFEELDEE